MAKEKKKIAICSINSNLSGAEKRFVRIAHEMCQLRNDVVLILNRELYKLSLGDIELRERVIRLEKSGYLIVLNDKKHKNKYINTLIYLIDIYIKIKRYNIKSLHCSLRALRFVFIKKVCNINYIAEITSPDVANSLCQSKFHSHMVSLFDKIVVVSEGVKNRTIDSLIKINKEHQIEKIYTSTIPFFLPKDGGNEFDISEKENLITYASRLVDRKNPVLFARSVNVFLGENNSWKVAILGKGPLEYEVKAELKRHIESGRVIVDYTKDIYGYLKRSKIFVSLIYPDNYPSQSILEAMYMKNAILATNIGNTNKLVTEKNGFLVGDYEVQSVYEMLREAVSDQERLSKMGEESCKLVEEKFSKDIYLEELQAIYNYFS